MKISRDLFLVQPIPRGDTTIYIHSMPISREVFEGNYKLIAGTHAEITSQGPEYAISAGPRIAALALRDFGKELGAKKGSGDGGAAALLGEIKRLTNVIAPGQNAWEAVPVSVALQREVMEPEEWTEVENLVVFFILVSAMTRRAGLPLLLDTMVPMLGALITSLNPTDYLGSLQISTQDVPTQARVVSSVPS